MEGKTKGESTSKITSSINGVLTEITNQKQMEKIIAK